MFRVGELVVVRCGTHRYTMLDVDIGLETCDRMEGRIARVLGDEEVYDAGGRNTTLTYRVEFVNEHVWDLLTMDTWYIPTICLERWVAPAWFEVVTAQET